jgi:hypothetical protein
VNTGFLVGDPPRKGTKNEDLDVHECIILSRVYGCMTKNNGFCIGCWIY